MPYRDKRGSNLKTLSSRWRAFGMTLMLFLLPLAVWAHDEDEKPVPMDPQTQRAQLLTFGVIGALVVGVVIFYYIRRAQLLRSENAQEGFRHDE